MKIDRELSIYKGKKVVLWERHLVESGPMKS